MSRNFPSLTVLIAVVVREESYKELIGTFLRMKSSILLWYNQLLHGKSGEQNEVIWWSLPPWHIRRGHNQPYGLPHNQYGSCGCRMYVHVSHRIQCCHVLFLWQFLVYAASWLAINWYTAMLDRPANYTLDRTLKTDWFFTLWACILSKGLPSNSVQRPSSCISIRTALVY